MNLVILGPPGSGKGTQAGLLVKKFNLVHVDMGLVLRQASQESSSLGKKINKIINQKKELVPDRIVREVLRQKLKEISKNKGLILDGAPRRESQIGAIGKELSKSKRKIDAVIYVNVSLSEAVRRISRRYQCSNCGKRLILRKDVPSSKSACPACGSKIQRRKDDTPRGVKKRFAVFKKETFPVIKYYREKGMLIEVNGKKNLNTVSREIIKQFKAKKLPAA